MATKKKNAQKPKNIPKNRNQIKKPRQQITHKNPLSKIKTKNATQIFQD